MFQWVVNASIEIQHMAMLRRGNNVFACWLTSCSTISQREQRIQDQLHFIAQNRYVHMALQENVPTTLTQGKTDIYLYHTCIIVSNESEIKLKVFTALLTFQYLKVSTTPLSHSFFFPVLFFSLDMCSSLHTFLNARNESLRD